MSQPKLVLIFFLVARLGQLAHTLLEHVLAEFAPEFDEAAFIFVAVLLVGLALVPGFEFGLELVVEFTAHGNRAGWLIKRGVGNILPL